MKEIGIKRDIANREEVEMHLTEIDGGIIAAFEGIGKEERDRAKASNFKNRYESMNDKKHTQRIIT